MEDKELDELLEKSEYAKKAMELFKEGYNCAQSVFLAFVDMYDIDEKTALKLSSSFGAGMGRLREVCGAVSGMFMVAGVLYGYESPKAFEEKTKHYERIQELAEQYKEFTGSIICRELLGLDVKKDSPVPEKRTNEYYKKRPCVKMVGIGAMLMENYIKTNQVPHKMD
ncbi:MAG: C_GCAxxG_C_C family protein [Lachnospiraceae bacterium]|nr:C_GCAxxG_C_C family protein [Lachnospiraceae bacterium]